MSKAKNLVIVESPAKAKTIEKFLGKQNYTVVASVGHVRDLPKSQFGIDIEHDFAVKYITIRGKGDTIKNLKKEARKANKIFLASDPDREGEAIAWHLQTALNLDPESQCRIVFNEITKEAVKEAVKHPRMIDTDLVDAQQARRVLDRMVGYKLSPLLWRKVKKGLSAGRVQSVALRLICEREEEIAHFVPEEYWSLKTALGKESDESFQVKLAKHQGKKIEIPTEEVMQNILEDLKDSQYQVTDISKSARRKNPPAPFTTSTMQQDAARRLNFTARKTMRIAQRLYEGVSLEKGGAVGLITYMRTDSVRISETAAHEAKGYIQETFGESYIGNNSYRGKKSNTNIQDAHEAIRPTSALRDPAAVKPYLSRDEFRLYQLIWSRFMASQMAAVRSELTKVTVKAKDYEFAASGSVILFDGYLKIYEEKTDKEDDGQMPLLKEGTILTFLEHHPQQHFTQPPARYNEASLIKTMEEKGIGRPSTYAAVIETIIGRNYVVREEKQFFPTEIGDLVNELLVTHFAEIITVDFTAQMESELDDIEDGKREWKTVIADFWSVFEQLLDKAEEEIGEVKIEDEVTDIICEKCGRPFAIKMGRFGKFLACTGFPQCRNTRPLLEEIGVKCPKCQNGEIVRRRSKKGRVFYGCSNYPECDFVTWGKPTGARCPECEEGWLVEQPTRHGVEIKCENKYCNYKRKEENDG